MQGWRGGPGRWRQSGGPALDAADRVRRELGGRVGGGVGRDEVAQLPGAGSRADARGCAGGGLEQLAGLGRGVADGVLCVPGG